MWVDSDFYRVGGRGRVGPSQDVKVRPRTACQVAIMIDAVDGRTVAQA